MHAALPHHIKLSYPALRCAADNRRNRGRLQQAGGASELATAFQDERLDWESREQAASMLQDLAAVLAQVRPAGGDPGASWLASWCCVAAWGVK